MLDLRHFVLLLHLKQAIALLLLLQQICQLPHIVLLLVVACSCQQDDFLQILHRLDWIRDLTRLEVLDFGWQIAYDSRVLRDVLYHRGLLIDLVKVRLHL